MRTIMGLLMTATLAQAEVKSKTIDYDTGGAKCKGLLVWDDAAKEKRPGVLVFHEWWGLNDYAKKRAEMLAKEGYVTFCADLYGDGKTTEHPEDAKKFMTGLSENQERWLGRAEAALKAFAAQPEVDATKVAAIGYCFGGATALVLGMSGADLKAVAMFHAGFPPVSPERAKALKARLLVCHGGADAFIPEDKVTAFRKVLDEAKANYEFITYPGVTHSFTVEGVEKKMPMLKYDADADKKSWESMLKLFKETLK